MAITMTMMPMVQSTTRRKRPRRSRNRRDRKSEPASRAFSLSISKFGIAIAKVWCCSVDVAFDFGDFFGLWLAPQQKKNPQTMLTEQELEEHPDNIEGLEGLDPSW
jgi:hypothetical protein